MDGRTEYHEKISEIFWNIPDIRTIVENAGLRRDKVFWQAGAFTVWRDVLDLALECGREEALHQAILAKVDADGKLLLCQLHARMLPAAPLAAVAAGAAAAAGNGGPAAGGEHWYRAPLPHRARLVGQQARRAVFDRVDLSSYLDSMHHGLTTVFVDGTSGTGRSYSWALLQHVAAAHGHRPVWIDIKRRWGPPPAPPCTARALLAAIAGRLDVPLDLTSTETTQPDTEPRVLVDKLIGAWPPPKAPPGGRFWILLDGLDHTNITSWAIELVEQLVLASDNSEFAGVQPQFVVTGYQGTVAQVLISTAREQLQAISRREVEQFFRETADHLGQPVDTAFLESLVARAYEGLSDPPDLELLNRRSADLAREVLAGVAS